jgi:hypothetical protein
MIFTLAFIVEGRLQAAPLEPPPESTAFLPSEGARIDYSLDSPVIEVGSVLINAAGKGSVQARDVRMIGLAGAFHITRGGEHLTVAALTTPVLLRSSDALLLIPAKAVAGNITLGREHTTTPSGVFSRAVEGACGA